MNLIHLQDNIYRIPVPVPFPMKYIYCYLIRSEGGWTLIDAGFNYEEARKFWLEVFKELNIHPKEIKTMYLTHFHPDHFGLTGWLQELTEAPVYISSIDFEMVNRLWGAESEQVEKMREMCLTNGVSEELTEQILVQMRKLEEHVRPLPELRILDTESVVFGDKEWQVIDIPGHSDGHICFYDSVGKTVIIGDHILDKITPNVSLWPGCNPNPLQAYMESLKKIGEMDIDTAYPAHGTIVENVNERIEQILVHHEERLDRMYEFAKEGKTGFQVASEVFSHMNLNPHQWRFALAETLSHLEYLFYSKRLKKTVDDSIIYYLSN